LNYLSPKAIYFLKKFGKESFYVLITNIVQVIEKVFVIMIVSRALTISDFGIYGLALTVSSLIFLIIYTPFYNGVHRYSVISRALNQDNNFISVIFRSWIIISFFVLSLTILFYFLLLILNKSQWFQITSFVLIFTILSSLLELIVSYYKSLRKHKSAFILRSLDMTIKVLLIFILVLRRLQIFS